MLAITNLTKMEVDGDFLQKAAQTAFAVLEMKTKEVSLVLVGDEKMKELNGKYRGKDEITDVLSFGDLNEIVICAPQAKRQSRLLKTGLKNELTRLLAHGIVHLAGYDHEKSVREAERFFVLERKIWHKINEKQKQKSDH